MAPMVGAHVIFTDEHRVKHDALVTFLHNAGDPEKYPLGKATINLLYVSGDESKSDQYGRQIERKSSVPAPFTEEVRLAGGYFYELP